MLTHTAEQGRGLLQYGLQHATYADDSTTPFSQAVRDNVGQLGAGANRGDAGATDPGQGRLAPPRPTRGKAQILSRTSCTRDASMGACSQLATLSRRTWENGVSLSV